MVEVYNIELDRDGLHRNIGGGFPTGSIVVIIGDYGAGKSAVTQRVMYGMLKNGHSVTNVSTEFTTKGFIEQMKSLNYNIVDYLLNRELLYIPVHPLIGKARPRDDFLGRLITSKQLFEREIIVIDTFSAPVKHDIDRDRALEVLTFFKKLCATGKTFILTVERGELPDDLVAPFKADSDVYLELDMGSLEGTTTRTIVVKRYVGSIKPIVEATGFRIEPRVGFIIDITTVA